MRSPGSGIRRQETGSHPVRIHGARRAWSGARRRGPVGRRSPGRRHGTTRPMVFRATGTGGPVLPDTRAVPRTRCPSQSPRSRTRRGTPHGVAPAAHGAGAGAGTVSATGLLAYAANREWAGSARSAPGVVALLPLLLGADAAGGQTSPCRVLLWIALGLLLLFVLLPNRVLAAPGLLTTKEPLCERHVRTDLLASVDLPAGISPRLLLVDIEGNRLEIAPVSSSLIRSCGIWNPWRGRRAVPVPEHLSFQAAFGGLARPAAEKVPRCPEDYGQLRREVYLLTTAIDFVTVSPRMGQEEVLLSRKRSRQTTASVSRRTARAVTEPR